MICKICKGQMTPMINSWFCPNDCDRPKKTSFSMELEEIRKIDPPSPLSGLYIHQHAQPPPEEEGPLWFQRGGNPYKHHRCVDGSGGDGEEEEEEFYPTD